MNDLPTKAAMRAAHDAMFAMGRESLRIPWKERKAVKG